MKVKALKAGFVRGQRIRKDDVFEVNASDFSDKWMEKVSKAGRKPKKEERSDVAQPTTLAEIQEDAPKTFYMDSVE